MINHYLSLNDFCNCHYSEEPIYVHYHSDLEIVKKQLLFTVKSEMECFTYLQDKFSSARVLSWELVDGAIHVGIERKGINGERETSL